MSTPKSGSVEKPDTVIRGFVFHSGDEALTPIVTPGSQDSAAFWKRDRDQERSSDGGHGSSAAEDPVEILRIENIKLREVIARLGKNSSMASALPFSNSLDDVRLMGEEKDG